MLDDYGIEWYEDRDAGYCVATIDGESVGHCALDDDGKTWLACMDGQMPATELGEFGELAMAKETVARSVRDWQTTFVHS